MKTVLIAVCTVLALSGSEDVLANSSFSPNGCGFLIDLPGNSGRYEVDVENIHGQLIRLEGAEAVVDDGRGFIRAECGRQLDISASSPSRDQMTRYMQIVATRLGLSLPAYEYSQGEQHVLGTVTGTKMSERGALTIRVTNYVGPESTMTVYVASRSSDL